MNYCSHCGASVELVVPDGDNRERYICRQCGVIHYQNPKIVAGVLPWLGDQILLCKRAIEPCRGRWTLPAGFMELGETTREAALRETWEEAKARVKDPELYLIFNIPHIDQVYMIFRGELVSTDFAPGEESLETRLFSEAEIPWRELAFSSIKASLTQYFNDRRNNHFPVHMEDLKLSMSN